MCSHFVAGAIVKKLTFKKGLTFLSVCDNIYTEIKKGDNKNDS